MGAEPYFRVLGPFEVVRGAEALAVPAGKQRVLLAALLVRAGQVVPAGELISWLWEKRVPADGRAALQIHVTRLRRALADLGLPPLIETRSSGYRLDIAADQVDLGRFRARAERARASRDLGDLLGESEQLRAALALWRGPALVDIASDTLHRDEVAALAEERLRLVERYFDLELELGRHGEIVVPLRAELAEHPLRERLWAQLMLALHHGGRQAEAVEVFRTASRRLREELGVGPGRELTRLHAVVLGEPVRPPGLAGPADQGWRSVCELPGGVPDFTGRAAEVDQVVAWLAEARGAANVPVVTLVGPPGIGKTALAVHAAHRLRGEFPDGQWFVWLGAHRERAPRPTEDILADWLVASGVAHTAVPADGHARAAMFRARLADRRVLLLLDDADSAEQVIPLLPGTSAAAVLVTSRCALPELIALRGAHQLTLGALAPGASADLLARALGADRVATAPAAVAELVRLCAGVPLALRIAVARLLGQPGQSVERLAGELRDGDRLAGLALGAAGRMSVRQAFASAYTRLSPRAARAFRFLGVAEDVDFTAESLAALLDRGVAETSAALAELAGTSLVDEHVPGRYRLPELLRLYAAQRGQVEDRAELPAAVRRLLAWYSTRTAAAVRAHCPEAPPLLVSDVDGADGVGPLTPDWLRAEGGNLRAVVRLAVDRGESAAAWRLADAAHGFFWTSRDYRTWREVADLGLRAALAVGERTAVAAMSLSLGLADLHLASYADAERALTAARDHGVSAVRAAAEHALGALLHRTGRSRAGLAMLEQALQRARGLGLRAVEARALRDLAAVLHAVGRLTEAMDAALDAWNVGRALGTAWAEAESLVLLSASCRELSQLPTALGYGRRGLAVAQRAGAGHEQARAHCGLSVIHRHLGDFTEAISHGEAALELARKLGDQVTEAEALVVLGDAHRADRKLGPAEEHHRRALRLARALRHRPIEIEAGIGLALVFRYTGNRSAALRHGREAVAAARRSGLRLLQGRALGVLAVVHLMADRHDQSLRTINEALTLYRETGHRLEHDCALRWLDQVRGAVTDLR
ncbi:DNA-binding transcriptional activator of the SARP family [Goodfellowiella coeruleoviolacea]|uniref:DNA-binding transcriptional activator of the SARP family n=1 Tax=Goodfellowiella coeruleoviolacea TaxID=334858 RepID=A0AAE3GGH0_9PSEU|nr:DNA-binding transcriptional activator of the SARP family [Goodfellowiella coeruleoviolacea]